ncbi:cAMP-binding protein-catabolite gene activator and regulatory subunit of cAMP-dependent protein kinase [Rhodospirillaceae bacterium LM-1]|nr:cAMP-binding protein-catabolite gene activator and regulatory subunit of cAMP-dependent protein kinase [Rhodospirillaceae bacterium LM-1]
MGNVLGQNARPIGDDNARGLTANDLATFSSLPFFCELGEPCLRKMTQEAKVVRYQRGDILFHQGEEAKWLHILLDGQIGLVGSASGGDETIVEIFKNGEVFIAAAVLTKKPYLMTAKALTTSRLLLVPGDKLLSELRDNSDLSLAMIISLAKHFRTLVREIKDLKLKSASQRLALYLMGLTPRREGSVIMHLPHNKNVIAGRVGIRPETLSRLFQTLKQYGVVCESQTVAITDLGILAAFCQEGDEIV